MGNDRPVEVGRHHAQRARSQHWVQHEDPALPLCVSRGVRILAATAAMITRACCPMLGCVCLAAAMATYTVAGSASGLVCSEKRDTLLRAYNLTRAVGREGVVTQRLCEVSGIRRRQVAFCKAGICQSFVLLGRKRIFVVS